MYKLIIYFVLFITIIIVIYPVMIMKSCGLMYATPQQHSEYSTTTDDNTYISDTSQPLSVKLYLTKSKKIINLPLEEYVKGVIAGEMPASFEFEALKAQAVAARTYVINKMLQFGNNGCTEHNDVDVCDNPNSCQAWLSETQLRNNWGHIEYASNWKKISKAVEETASSIIVYNGKPIDPLFHSTSGGKTENSEEVFITKLPYLRSVVSEGEETAPKFSSTVKLSRSEFVKKFKSKYPKADINTNNIESKVRILEYSEGGRIKNISIGGIKLNGNTFRNIFNLNSTNARFHYSGNTITITTLGFGHGVGMSQWGANNMAANGSSYKDIIKHYYQNVDIVKISQENSTRVTSN